MTQAPGYSITIRMHVTPELHASGQIVAAVTEAGAFITGLDVSDPGTETTVVDLSALAHDPDHAESLRTTLNALSGCKVDQISDSVFLVLAAGSSRVPSVLNWVSAMLIAAPMGVGQPRSAWVMCRNWCSVVTDACHPWATATHPTARPSR